MPRTLPSNLSSGERVPRSTAPDGMKTLSAWAHKLLALPVKATVQPQGCVRREWTIYDSHVCVFTAFSELLFRLAGYLAHPSCLSPRLSRHSSLNVWPYGV